LCVKKSVQIYDDSEDIANDIPWEKFRVLFESAKVIKAKERELKDELMDIKIGEQDAFYTVIVNRIKSEEPFEVKVSRLIGGGRIRSEVPWRLIKETPKYLYLESIETFSSDIKIHKDDLRELTSKLFEKGESFFA